MAVLNSNLGAVLADIQAARYWTEQGVTPMGSRDWLEWLEWLGRTVFSFLPCVDSVTQVCARQTFDEIVRACGAAANRDETPLIRDIRANQATLMADIEFLTQQQHGAHRAHATFMTFLTNTLGMQLGRVLPPVQPPPAPVAPPSPSPSPAAAAAAAPAAIVELSSSHPAAAVDGAAQAARFLVPTAPPDDVPAPPAAPQTLFGALPQIAEADQRELRAMIQKLAEASTWTKVQALYAEEKALKAQGKQTLEEKGDELGGRIHPLRFLEFILNDDELRRQLDQMSNNRLIWGTLLTPGFIPSFKERLKNWDKDGGPRFEHYLEDFARSLQVNSEEVKKHILPQPSQGWGRPATQGDNWSDLIKWIIAQKAGAGAAGAQA